MKHRLLCHPCRVVHEFTVEEMERLVYCLQGMFGDAATREPVTEVEACDCVPCLREALDESFDIDGYSEWTEALIKSAGRAADLPHPGPWYRGESLS